MVYCTERRNRGQNTGTIYGRSLRKAFGVLGESGKRKKEIDVICRMVNFD